MQMLLSDWLSHSTLFNQPSVSDEELSDSCPAEILFFKQTLGRASRANKLVLRTSNFQGSNYQTDSSETNTLLSLLFTA